MTDSKHADEAGERQVWHVETDPYDFGNHRYVICDKNHRIVAYVEQRKEAELAASAPSMAARIERLEAFAKSILIYMIEDDPGLVWLRVGSHPACSFDANSAEATALLNLEQHRRAALGGEEWAI